jgi:hypothetical protein
MENLINKYLTEAVPNPSKSEKKAMLSKHKNDMLFGKFRDKKWYVIQPFGGKVFIEPWASPDNDYPPGADWSKVKDVKLDGFPILWSWDLYS